MMSNGPWCDSRRRLKLLEKRKAAPKVILLEFAVNDYEGQDHVQHVVHILGERLPTVAHPLLATPAACRLPPAACRLLFLTYTKPHCALASPPADSPAPRPRALLTAPQTRSSAVSRMWRCAPRAWFASCCSAFPTRSSSSSSSRPRGAHAHARQGVVY